MTMYLVFPVSLLATTKASVCSNNKAQSNYGTLILVFSEIDIYTLIRIQNAEVQRTHF
jgi:hypothetical protein